MTITDTPRLERDNVEREFARRWAIGNAGEDWASWAQLSMPDAHYLDHFWGPLHGRDEIDLWIHAERCP